MIHAVAYYRVSTERQEESMLGLEAQMIAVRSFVEAKDFLLVNEFTEVETGRRNDRPVLQKAIAYCRRKKARLVIAKLDRLSRNLAFISALMESKVKFIAVDKPYEDELMLHIAAVFAQYERKLIGTRTSEALQAAKRKGVKLGKYSVVLAKKNKEAAQNFARKMQPTIEAMRTEGIKGNCRIAKELNRRRIKTFRGKKHKWHENTVRRLIKQINSLPHQIIEPLNQSA